MTERTIDRNGQFLLAPEFTLEGWWTDLAMEPEDVIELYRQHATSEQFHSEFKTDLDLERLPSGKFATNALMWPWVVLPTTFFALSAKRA